jgi:type IV fimbrial biogenesis protein FimT
MGTSRGFTLIELLVTIAVLAVVATMAAPSFIQMVRSNQLRSDTRDFVDLLSETRSEAIFKQSDRVVALDSSVATPFKTWVPTHVTKTSGDSSVTFNRLGQTSISTNGQCFIFEHSMYKRVERLFTTKRQQVVRLEGKE